MRHIWRKAIQNKIASRHVLTLAAGFTRYSRSEDASRLRRILDERELTAGLLTL
jgi:hypothetical protein